MALRTHIRRDSPGAPPAQAPEPDLKQAVELVLELMAIPGASRQEGQVAQRVVDHLKRAGAPEGSIRFDRANQASQPVGEVGNLILKLPGTRRGPRRLLMAHLDTVPLCVGARPVREGDVVRSADANTGLGADDRAGTAAILHAAMQILSRELPHPPLTFLWVVQEEIGLYGSRYLQESLLGKPQLAFNWDGGPAEKITLGATGAYRIRIEVGGLASHAGVAPEQGVSAIAIAGLAIAELQSQGWLGAVQRGRRSGTSNIGVIRGGEATNVVTPKVELRAEARSHDPEFRKRIAREIEQAFRRAARQVQSASGKRGTVTVEQHLDYESFRLAADEPCVEAASAAIRRLGLQPLPTISNGGLDANWMTAHGIPTVTLGCGQRNIHTIEERLDVPVYETACRIALRLATASEELP